MSKIEPLGLQIKAPARGTDVAKEWDVCWVLHHRRQNFNSYCFGAFMSHFSYEAGRILNRKHMFRLSFTPENLIRVFTDNDLHVANGVTKTNGSSWLDNYRGQTINTFLWKDPETQVVTKTTTHVDGFDHKIWSHGSVPYDGVEEIYLKKSVAKSKTHSSQDDAALEAIKAVQESVRPTRSNSKNQVTNAKVTSEINEQVLESRKSKKRAIISLQSSNSSSSETKSTRKKEEEDNETFVHMALVFSLVNVVFRKSGQDFLTFGTIPVEPEEIPTHIDWNSFKVFDMSKDFRKSFMSASIRIEGKFPKNGWSAVLFSNGSSDAFFFDRKSVNLTKLLEMEEEIDIVQDSVTDTDNQIDYMCFNELNICYASEDKQYLCFGRLHTSDESTHTDFGSLRFTKHAMNPILLEKFKALPLLIDHGQGDQPWYERLLNKRKRFYWFFNKHEGTLTKTDVTCAIIGGFSHTRKQACMNGIQVTSGKDFNNDGVSYQYTNWPREYISGERGYCSLIAAYYICMDLSLQVVRHLQQEQHTEIAISDSSTIFVTDGTYRILMRINHNLSRTFLNQIYPSYNGTTSDRKSVV